MALAVSSACLALAWGNAGAQVRPGTVPILNPNGVISGAVVGTAAPNGRGGSTLTVSQSLQNAIVEWQSFNVGSASSVIFKQPNASAAILNRIYDLSPSIIQGAIKANGIVYLVNQNGILFDRGSQVNVGGLVASTLNIGNGVFAAGLTSPTQGSVASPTFVGGYDSSGNPTPTVPTGSIQIGRQGDSAAQAPKITAASGGSILIIAPVVNNTSGIITAPDGQVILAAGASVYLYDPGVANPPLGYSPYSNEGTAPASLRGFVVEVSAGDSPVNLTGLLQNTGQISAARGNVTLAGLAVNQAGRVSASSAALYNGTVYLQAGTVDGNGGTVTLAPGSVTEALPDTIDPTKLSQAQTWVGGSVGITGKTIIDQGKVIAPGGSVYMTAKDNSDPTGSRIYLDQGSIVDASGSWSTVPFSDNLLTFKVTSNELANSPDQKGGLLEGSTVVVDLRDPNNILDLSGYISGQLFSVPQKAAAGGSVFFNSAGDVIDRSGSVVNVSGGGFNYTGGYETTTALLGADGKIYNINTAPENVQYVEVLNSFSVNHPQWGLTQTFANPLFNLASYSPAYAQGASAGSITFNQATGLVLDGRLQAQVTVGPNQLANAPRGGTLTIAPLAGSSESYGVDNLTIVQSASDTLTPGFSASTSLTPAESGTVVLGATSLGGSATTPIQFDTLNLTADGTITVPSNVTLKSPIGGTINLNASAINVSGSLVAPSGTVTLATIEPGSLPSANPNLPVSAPPAQSVTLHPGSLLSTAGIWLNDDTPTGAPLGPVLPTAMAAPSGAAPTAAIPTTQGGSIALIAPSNNILAGSVIDVSGGGQIGKNGAITGGNGGKISISASTFEINDANRTTPITTNQIDGTLKGYSLATGGSLILGAGNVSIADAPGASASGATPVLALAPSFFTQGGFSSYDVTGAYGLNVAAGTTIAPTTQTEIVDAKAAASLPSGGNLAGIAQFYTRPEYSAGTTNVALRAPNLSGSPLVVETGAAIVTNPKSTITLQAAGGITVDGSLTAPDGTINLNVTGQFNAAGNDLAAVPLILGSSSVLSTAGIFVTTPNTQGLTTGSILGGGTVSLSARNGSVTALPGSTIDIGGTSHALSVATGSATQPFVTPILGSDAGLLTISSTDGISMNGTIDAAGGTAQNAGGSFVATLTNRNAGTYAPSTSLSRNIVVSQGDVPPPADGAIDASLSMASLQSAGFDKIRLQSESAIVFQGQVNATFARGITLDSPEYLLSPGANVSLASAQLELANSFGSRVPDLINQTNGPTPLHNGLASDGSPSTPVPTVSGTGTFTAEGAVVDLFGSLTINGAQQVNIVSQSDLRLSGRQVGSPGSPAGAALIGSLTSQANINLVAAQVYPTTQSQFSVQVADQPDATAGDATRVQGGVITIQGNGHAAAPALSAGGQVTLSADEINQNGVLIAPFGEITLAAGSNLNLGPQSRTSVSGAGLLVPFGETNAGIQWLYSATNNDPGFNEIVAPPTKNISFSAQNIDQKPGAVVDIAGGGDILGIEFVPHSSSSQDLLLQPNTYAILPAAHLPAAPYDPDIAARADDGIGFSPTQNRDAAVYNSIKIGAGAVVPQGNYVLLPATYALLPGAYLVQVQTANKYQNLPFGASYSLPNGTAVVSAQLAVANTDISQSQTIGVILQPGAAAALKASDYNLDRSSFFVQYAKTAGLPTPSTTADAGHLVVDAGTSLQLAGTFDTQGAAGGAGGEVDLTATKIAIVDQTGNPAIDSSFVQFQAGQLTKFGGDLLIGGTRTIADGTATITSGASDIVVENTAQSPLTASELILTASQSIEFKPGSVVTASGRALGEQLPIVADPSGALVRASNSGLVTVTRGPTGGAAGGEILVDAGATINAQSSIQLNATQGTQVAGTLHVAPGGGIALAAPGISLGDVTGLPTNAGLSLTNGQLANFAQLGTLDLSSTGSIDIYGATVLGGPQLGNLTLDATALLAHLGSTSNAAANTTIEAGSFAFQNTSGLVSNASLPAAGALNISANQATLGQGTKLIAGFGTVSLNLAGTLTATGAGELDSAAPTAIRTAQITGASGAQATLQAADLNAAAGPTYFPLTLSASGSNQVPPSGVGAQLNLVASSIDDSAAIVMKSGSVVLMANGAGAAGNLILEPGALIDVGGASKSFNGATVTADAGSVALSANGLINLATGSSISVAAGPALNAGALFLAAAQIQTEGTLLGTGGTAGQQGSATLVAGQLAPSGFSQINAVLNAGGFTGARSLELQSGDLVVASSDHIIAHDLTLSADQGSVIINGELDANSAAGGGKVALYGGNGVVLNPGAVINASATSSSGGAGIAGANGGAVTIDSRATNLALQAGLVFQQGATIDLSPALGGSAGSVTFVANQNATQTGILASLDGTIQSQGPGGNTPAEVIAQGRALYSTSAPLAGNIASYAASNANFINQTTASGLANLFGGLTVDGGVNPVASAQRQLQGAVELDSTGNLTLNTGWDLTTANWLAAGDVGTLTLRAAGNVVVNSFIGLPNNTSLPAGASWGVQIAGGANLNAADPLAVNPLSSFATSGQGNVILGTAASALRTGTGSIAIAAGNDFSLANAHAVIYTVGETAVPDSENRWGSQGGSITISAQHDATGVASEWITDWMRRDRGSNSAPPSGDWYSYRSNFFDGLGTFGGGDISLTAGNDINDLPAMVATAGLVTIANGLPSLTVFGGGNLNVRAGGNILGGDYLVARGNATLFAAGSVGTVASPTQLYLMGQSDSSSTQGASMKVQSGGGIAIQDIADPTAVLLTNSVGTDPSFNSRLPLRSSFFTYSPTDEVDLLALGGDLVLGGNLAYRNGLNSSDRTQIQSQASQPTVLPPIVSAVAWSGDLTGAGSVATFSNVLYPSAAGRGTFYADGSITGLNLFGLDLNPSNLPGWSNPTTSVANSTVSETLIAEQLGGVAPSEIVTRNSGSPYFVDIQALTGNISGSNFVIPAVARIYAGGSITTAEFTDLQNLNSNDLSILQANSGSITVPTNLIQMGGPGQLLLEAAGTINLGQGGLQAVGATFDPSLPIAQSARLTVVPGVSGQLDVANLDSALFGLRAVGEQEITTDGLEAVYKTYTSSGGASAPANLALVESTLQTLELKDAAKGITPNYKDEAQAVMGLFFGKAKFTGGDLNSYQTSIQTDSGSTIDLLAPAGNITVGLTTPSLTEQIGVITNAGGAINSYLSDNFTINSGKVVTAEGGDIEIFTTLGNIDAGRGAKTSVTAPAPQRIRLPSGSYEYVLSNGVSGSGIQTVTTPANPAQPHPPAAGSIYLFAPEGIINAGEAGVTSGGNLFVFAREIVNSSNFASQGTSTGVPTAVSGSVASTLAASGSASATGSDKAAEEAARSAANAAATSAGENFAAGILSVEVLGFGSADCKETDEKCLKGEK